MVQVRFRFSQVQLGLGQVRLGQVQVRFRLGLGLRISQVQVRLILDLRCPFWQCFFSRLISAPFLVSYRPDNTSAYLQDVWLPSCNLKFRLQGLFHIRIIKFIAGTTLGRANYGWDNFRPGPLWLGQLLGQANFDFVQLSMCGPTLVWATLVRTTMGGTTLS